MEIEIITTKKKLSKSIVNQMRQASMGELLLGTTIGYLINVRKNIHKAVLIKCKGEFYIIPANYTKGEKSVYRRIGKWSQSIKFKSEAQCNSWWRFYRARMEEAINQIYV
ncbi:MAG: hypothetical protein ACTSQ8_25825 [Candidatus Helarchaeota archaeon]